MQKVRLKTATEPIIASLVVFYSAEQTYGLHEGAWHGGYLGA